MKTRHDEKVIAILVLAERIFIEFKNEKVTFICLSFFTNVRYIARMLLVNTYELSEFIVKNSQTLLVHSKSNRLYQ